MRKLIDSYIKDVPVEAIGKAVKGFKWHGEQGSIFHWARLLDRLDEFFSYCTETHVKTLLDPDFQVKDELPLPDDEVISALDCSTEIMEHVAGKEHYNSLSQLHDLLSCSNPLLVHKTLLLLYTIYQRNASGYQRDPPDMMNRLQTIAAPVCGPTLLDIARQDVSLATAKDKFHFRFSIEPNPSEDVDELTEEEKRSSDNEPRIVKVAKRADLPQNDFEALKKIMSESGPVRGRRQRFRIVRNIRASAVYEYSKEELELEACNRFLAMSVLVPVGVSGELYGRMSIPETLRKLGSGDLLKEIFANDSILSEKVRLYAIYAFTSKFVGVERSSFKTDGVEKLLKNGKYSPLSVFLNRRSQLESLNSDIGIKILEAVITMVNTLSSISFICDDLLETGVLEILMPFLEDYSPAFATIRSEFLATIEILFLNNTSGVERLNSCNGLGIIKARLTREIDTVMGNRISSYESRFLIKKLFKALTRIVLTSEGIDETKVDELYHAMKKVFCSFPLFGTGVFDAATMCFRQILHHEPLQYKLMSSIGLDTAYLDALKSMKGRDGFVTLSIVPTISAICLSENGRNLVRSKHAIYLITDTFTDPRALYALPSAQAIGKSLEEMIRHHETMMGDVVEMLVSTVDSVRKIACTGELKVFPEDEGVGSMPKYVSTAISRLSDLLTPVCEANPSAVKAFLEQGGLQIFVDLLQPNMTVDCFSCTQASPIIISFLKILLRIKDNQEYVMEIILLELRKSLAEVNQLFTKLETSGHSIEDFSSLRHEDLPLLEPLMRSFSKSTLLMGSMNFSLPIRPLHLAIDRNLYFLPELDEVTGKAIRSLAIFDEWRIETDIRLKAMDENDISLSDFKQSDKEIELRRDVLNQFFRSSCQLHYAIARLADTNQSIWGDDELQCSHCPKTVALLCTNSITKCMNMWQHQGSVAPARKYRSYIRLCRLITAIISNNRQKSVNSYSANAFVRYGGLDLFLKLVNDVANECLEMSLVESQSNAPFAPKLKEIKEQEKQLEITGIGRIPLSKDVDREEWLKRSLVISAQHSLLSMFGILEIITERDAYKDGGPKDLTFFTLPYWIDDSLEAKFPDLITETCRRTASCLVSISLSRPRAWSLCPLPFTKFVKSLANSQKNGKLQKSISDEEMIQSIANEDREIFYKLMNDYQDLEKSVLVDILKQGGRENAFKIISVREKNKKASINNDGEKWVFGKDEPFTMETFRITADGKNLKAAKSRIMPWDAEACILLSSDKATVELIKSLQGAYAGQKAAIFVQESFESLLQMVKYLPSTVHTIANLLVESFENMSELRPIIENHLTSAINRMKGTVNKDFAGWNPSLEKDILAPLLHLVASVLNISRSCRVELYSLTSPILQLLDIWRKGCISTKRSTPSSQLKVPKWVDACLLSLSSMLAQKLKPLDITVLGENDFDVDTDLKSDFLRKLKLLIPPLESSEISKFVSASNHAIDSLKIASKSAETFWKPLPNEAAASATNYYEPCPKSSVSASLELLTTTSKVRKAAEAILNGRGHHIILTLSHNLHGFDSYKMIRIIMHHLVEDDNVLQGFMETSIQSSMQKRKRIGVPTAIQTSKSVSLKQFITSFMRLACRNCTIFCKVVDTTCDFSREGDKVNVKLVSDAQVVGSDDSRLPHHISEKEAANNDQDHIEKIEGKKTPKLASKKNSKKVPTPVSTVIDAIISRLIQASSPTFAQRLIEKMTETAVDSEGADKIKSQADLFCLSEQSFCINLIAGLSYLFSHCVTAFLRRDSDPLPEWITGKYSSKLNFRSPIGKSTGVQRDKGSGKKDKGKVFTPVQAGKGKSGSPNEGANFCFLIGFIIRNHISYCGSSSMLPYRQGLSKDGCSLLIALAERSTEGQKRVCQEIRLILHSFAYHGQANISDFASIRTLEKKIHRNPSVDVEGSLILLAAMLSMHGKFSTPESRESHHKAIVERLVDAGIVTLLVDTLSQLDLSEQHNHRLKILLSAIIRSLEKLTTVRATAKSADNPSDNELGMNFEDLVAQLNERGCKFIFCGMRAVVGSVSFIITNDVPFFVGHVAGEDEGAEDNLTGSDGNTDNDEDDLMQLDSDDLDLSNSQSYYTSDSQYSGSFLSDTPTHSNSEWSLSHEDVENMDSGDEPLVVGMYSSDSDESMEDGSSDDISDSESHEDEEDEGDEIQDYEYDLDDIFPPEEIEFDNAELGNQSRFIQSWGRSLRGEVPFGRSLHHNRLESQEGDSDDQDIFLDGNDEMDEYYSDDEDGMPSAFIDDRLISGYEFSNTNVPQFWIQESEGQGSIHWREQDPLFGTAFTSPRLHASRGGLFRSQSEEEETEAPCSIFHHPLIVGPNTIESQLDMQGRQGVDRPFGIVNEPDLSRLAQFRSMLPGDGRGLLGQPTGIQSESYSMQNMADRFTDPMLNRYAAAIDQSMGGRELESDIPGQRRRDRLDLASSRYIGDTNLSIFRTSSPPLLRPRQRQRTDMEARDADVDQPEELHPSGSTPIDTGVPQDQVRENLSGGPDIEDGDIEPIDPEFLAALPPDLQREVLENHERERRARRISRVASTIRRANRGPENSQNYISEIVAQIPEDLQAEAIMGLDALFDPGDFGHDEGTGDEYNITRDRTPAIRQESPSRNFYEALRARPSGSQGAAFGMGTRELLGQLGDWTVNADGRRPRSAGRIRRFDNYAIDYSEDSLSALERIPFSASYGRSRLGERSESRLDVQSDSKPLLSDDQVPQLLRLLRLSKWDGRIHLNRAIRHLTESKQTAKAIFQQIFGLLRCPLSLLEIQQSMLHTTLSHLNHPMPSLLTDLHGYIVQIHGSSIVTNNLGLEPPEDEGDDPQGVLSIAVVRRLLELLRHCFSLVRRGVDTVLDIEAPCLYKLYKSMGVLSQEIMDTGDKFASVPSLDVLLSLPLRHDISKSNLRGISLELVSKFLHHFEKVENEIHEKERKIREKQLAPKKGDKDGEYPSITQLEIEKLTAEHAALVEKSEGPRKAFKNVNSIIVKNYVMMLTYPSLKESETESVRLILQSLTAMNLCHWNTLAHASGEFVQLLSKGANCDLEDLANGNIANKVWRPDTKGVGIFRCLQVVAEGVFQLIIDRFDSKNVYLPEEAIHARDIAAQSLTNMLEQTKDSLWAPFNQATQYIEQILKDQSTSETNSLPLPVQLIKPYVESYFLLHDTLRCVTCSLDTLAQEVNELTEEEQAWTNKRDEVSRAAQEQATASFTRIQSIDILSPSQKGESSDAKSPEKVVAPCLPSSDIDFVRFAETHRKIVNLIVSFEPSVLEESMNMLLKHPKLLDFDNKRVYFRKRVQTLTRQLGHHSRLELNVRRAHAFEDSFNQLRVVSKSQLRSPLKVTFSGEEGVDAGGVSREWYQVMSREMFNPGISLFEAIPQGSSTYQPNPNSIVQTDEARGISHLDYFKFVGHVVGKALLSDQVIDAHFTRSFYKHLLGQPLTYRDIEGVDPDFYKNLSWMLENDIDGVLDLTFSEESDFFGQKSVIELCPNGANTKVTDQNKRDYVDAIARHRMTNAIQPQIHAFLEGFWNVVPRISLALFNDHELELMISGLPEVDILDLRANCEYHGYSAASQVILWFWEVAISMDGEQRANLLQFVTGTSKVPVGGFSELQAISGRQKFQIHKAFGSTDRLPTAHTCFNQLDLPQYNTKEQLKERLLMAIHEGKEGFGFA